MGGLRGIEERWFGFLIGRKFGFFKSGWFSVWLSREVSCGWLFGGWLLVIVGGGGECRGVGMFFYFVGF